MARNFAKEKLLAAGLVEGTNQYNLALSLACGNLIDMGVCNRPIHKLQNELFEQAAKGELVFTKDMPEIADTATLQRLADLLDIGMVDAAKRLLDELIRERTATTTPRIVVEEKK